MRSDEESERMQRICEPKTSPDAGYASERRAQGGGSMVCLWKDEFLALQAVQRAQIRSPRFDLRDLASAAIRLALELPDAEARIRDQALRDSFARHTGGQAPAKGTADARGCPPNAVSVVAQ
jgi:hypothetical protein